MKETKQQTLNPQQRKQMTLENHDAIEHNKDNIKTNKRIIYVLAFMVTALGSMVVYLMLHQHNIEVCQAKLFTHLTGQEAPSQHQLKADVIDGKPALEKIENPRMYRELFEGCE